MRKNKSISFKGDSVSITKRGSFQHLSFRKNGTHLGEISSECRWKSDARCPEVLEAKLAEVLQRPRQPDPHRQKAKQPPKNSLFWCLDKVAYHVGQHWENDKTRAPLNWTVKFIKQNLGIEVGHMQTDKVSSGRYKQLRSALKALKLSKKMECERAKSLGRITKQLLDYDLSPECEDLFSDFDSSTQKEAVDESFTYDDIRQMLLKLDEQSFTVQ